METKVKSVRVPQQKRSIEKRARIVEAAYKVFSEKGYHAAVTTDIAVEAEISTGTLYAYFVDKKELFLECHQRYADRALALLLDIFHADPNSSLPDFVETVIRTMIDLDRQSHPFQKEVLALVPMDPEVRAKDFELHQSVLSALVKEMIQRGLVPQVSREKVFLAVAMVEGISREVAFRNDPNLDVDRLVSLCRQGIVALATATA